jgi:hypothetical protein
MKQVTVTGYVVVEVAVEVKVPDDASDNAIINAVKDKVYEIVNPNCEYVVEYEFKREGGWHHGSYPAYEILDD